MKRRDFIENLSLGIGTIALSNTLPFNLKEVKKLGIALVGLGNYSMRQLAPALLETQLCKP